MNQGLITGLNRMREVSSDIYHQYIPIITDSTDIGALAQPILNMPVVANEFMSNLVNMLVYQSFMTKRFSNPLNILEGDRIPLGYSGQEIYTNPAKGRQFNSNDFAGLLYKYEADVKVQYMAVNMDLQYPVTISRHKLKQAFTSWTDLDQFVDELVNSLYNGAYIGEYTYTKGIVSGAYKDNKAVIEVVDAPTTESQAKAFVTKARELFLNFQTPSSKYNAWAKVGGEGRPIITWSEPQDIVFLIRNDISAYLDVNVLASAFNITNAELLGRIIRVDNFNIYDDEGRKVFDGSKILGFIGDKSWFRIKTQDMFLDEFYNANNRTWQYYLNLTKMYNFSLFANGVVIASENTSVVTTEIKFNVENVDLVENQERTVGVVATPVTGTTPITFDIESGDNFTIVSQNENRCTIKYAKEGSGVLKATAGNLSTTLNVTSSATNTLTTKATTKVSK